MFPGARESAPWVSNVHFLHFEILPRDTYDGGGDRHEQF